MTLQSSLPAIYGSPQTVKIFGVLHVIFASYALVSNAFEAMIMAYRDEINTLVGMDAEARAQAKAQAAMQEDMLGVNIFTMVLSACIAGVMMTAGVKLLRRRYDGLLWSNCYAYASLVGKVIIFVLSIIYALPVIKNITADEKESSLPPFDMEWMMLLGILSGIVLSSTYPVLTLILLNRKATNVSKVV